MTLLPPFLPQSIRYGQNAFPDVEPFSLRAAASYEDIQYSIVVWIRDQLEPWIQDNGSGSAWATSLIDSVNAALAADAQAVAAAISNAFAGSTGATIAPAATGVAATDTANLLAAIVVAQAGFLDLHVPQGHYMLTAPITWNANHGWLKGDGDVTLDWSTATFTGPALTIAGNGNDPWPAGRTIPHSGIKFGVEQFTLLGPDTDTGTVDGILFSDPGVGIDMVTPRHLLIQGFRDGVTYGKNTWSQSMDRCFVQKSHRYGVNLNCGSNTGECTTWTNSTIGGTHNASNTGVAVYAPAGVNIDFRMIGGSLDYNDLEGDLYGGSLTFSMVHIEDRNTGPMFRYTSTNATGAPVVSFRDCSWDSSTTTPRDHIHEITSASTAGGIVIAFDGVRGGVGSQVESWVQDNSGQGPTVTVAGWMIQSGNATNMAIGQVVNLLTNGTFDDSSSFVAAPGVRGWYASGAATFGFSGTTSGNGMRAANASAASGTVVQRIPIGLSRRPVRVQGKLATTAYTSGAIGIYAQFYGEDGTTPVGGQIRVGSDLAALTGGTSWNHNSARLLPPAGAVYLSVILSAVSFAGTGYWENVEAVSI